MPHQPDEIYVRSHVARDFLQSASLFRTDKLVIWEYVSNGLQYIDRGTNPIVRVTLDSRKKRITIVDNGRGMDFAGLKNFFVMHGENIDRMEGRVGRGRFGTGKSAAFGIADCLRINTVRGKRKSIVELTRASIESMSSEDPIPVRTIIREIATDEPNGTTVEIESVHLRSLDQSGVIHYIERHLAHWSKNVTVFVNNHECEFSEPPLDEEYRFRPDSADSVLQDAELIIRVSKAPLEEDLRGVAIYSRGIWHETTLSGSEGREMSQYIFGEIDIPALEEDSSPIAPFDISRSMRLNPNNETVRAVYSFIGQRIDEVRRSLVEQEKTRKSDEETKKLAEEASDIAKVINEDFEIFRQKVTKTRAQAPGAVDLHQGNSYGNGDGIDLAFGSDVPAVVISPTGGVGTNGNGGGGSGSDEPRTLAPQVEPGPPEAERLGNPVGTRKVRKPKGGFDVKFKNMGAEFPRAQYSSDERTIYINLDHPQLESARANRSVDDPVFRRLAYEVASSEYAIALASELCTNGYYIDPSDPIYDIRETLNRVARRGAKLYSD